MTDNPYEPPQTPETKPTRLPRAAKQFLIVFGVALCGVAVAATFICFANIWAGRLEASAEWLTVYAVALTIAGALLLTLDLYDD